MSSVTLPDMALLMQWVEQYAPAVLGWCIIGLAGTLILRLLLALFKKHSAFLRALSWLAIIGGVASLGGYWILTGEVPQMLDNITLSLSGITQNVPEQLKQVNMTGLIILGGGAVLAFLSGPLSRMFGGKNPGDSEIVIKTIGWLLAVLGTLITLGVI